MRKTILLLSLVFIAALIFLISNQNTTTNSTQPNTQKCFGNNETENYSGFNILSKYNIY